MMESENSEPAKHKNNLSEDCKHKTLQLRKGEILISTEMKETLGFNDTPCEVY